MGAWSWPMKRIDKTERTRCRFLVGVLPLAPTPKGVRCELRIILQQWNDKAAQPFSWCLDEMKYGTDENGKSTGPFREPTGGCQHVQRAEADWPAYFAVWGETGTWLLGELARLKTLAPPMQSALEVAD